MDTERKFGRRHMSIPGLTLYGRQRRAASIRSTADQSMGRGQQGHLRSREAGNDTPDQTAEQLRTTMCGRRAAHHPPYPPRRGTQPTSPALARLVV
jgi:hypothetical protein